MKERKGKIILLPYGDFTRKDIAVLLLLFGVNTHEWLKSKIYLITLHAFCCWTV